MDVQWTELDEARELEKELDEIDNPLIGYGIGFRGVDQGGYPLTHAEKLAIYGSNYSLPTDETIDDIKELPDVDMRQLVASGVTPRSTGRRNLSALLNLPDLDQEIQQALIDRYNLYGQNQNFQPGGNYLHDPTFRWYNNPGTYNEEELRRWVESLPRLTHWTRRYSAPNNSRVQGTQYNASTGDRNVTMSLLRERARMRRTGPDPTDAQGNPYMLEDRPGFPGLRGARSSQSYGGQGVGRRESLRGGGTRKKSKGLRRGGTRKKSIRGGGKRSKKAKRKS